MHRIVPMLLVAVLFHSASAAAEDVPIRIGWQTTWATQGQFVQALDHTNVLNKHGLKGELVGATYGAPLNEAALAGAVDVIFTADQPAAALLGRSDDWVIIGRLMFNRVGVYAPLDSPVKSLADLRGKTVAMPFGAAAQRVALKAMIDAGLDPKQDIKAINLDITEQPGLVKRGNGGNWGEVDALVGFDPMFAVIEVGKMAKVLHSGKVTSVIVMSRSFIKANPKAPAAFLEAFIEAVYFYGRNLEQVDNWFIKASQLRFGRDVLALAASVEPNIKAQEIVGIDIKLTPDLLAGLQEAADFLYDQGLVKKRVTMAEKVDLEFADAATAAISAAAYDPSSVKVENNE